MEALEPLPGKVGYFIGNDPRRWRNNIPTFAKVRYRDIYPGIDLIYYGNQNRIEYDFVLARGAEPGKIRLLFHGHDDAAISSNGDLVFRERGKEVRLQKPNLYQEINGVRQSIIGRYALRHVAESLEVGFEVGAYDKSKPLMGLSRGPLKD